MNQRSWKLLCWNVRGINSGKKWNAIRDCIVESNCDIACFQETKRATFDLTFIRQFTPPCFDCFEFLPSNGASGGSIIIWKSSFFTGSLAFQNEYATSIEFVSLHNNAVWLLTNIYAPCTPAGEIEFVHWFQNIQMPDMVNWLVVGDFNLYRRPEDRNKPVQI